LDIGNFAGIVSEKGLRLNNIQFSFTPVGLKMSNLNPEKKFMKVTWGSKFGRLEKLDSLYFRGESCQVVSPPNQR
jgi:hypothetical protein